ncbi:MAG: restriction endonuclease [Comamonadaceae bacterium]|nr:restriction endonuclease [Comamonadaceae bacterium]
MPARSNHFQKLVKTINKHLAPAGAKITESAMLHDAEAEIDREIDILVESTILNCNLKIGIECTAESAPLEIRKIESFKEKHRKVGINQTIVVSKNGFSESAKTYAKKHNIKLLTFNSAKKENWLKQFEFLQGLSIYGGRYFIRGVSATLDPNKVTPDFLFNHEVIVFVNGEDVPLVKFAADLFVSSEVSKKAFKELMANEKTGGGDPWIEVGFELNEKYEFKDSSGRVSKPQSIVVVMGYKSNYRSLEMQQVAYEGKDMVVGGFFDKNSNAHVAFNEVDGKLTGTLEVSESFLPPMPSVKPTSELPK